MSEEFFKTSEELSQLGEMGLTEINAWFSVCGDTDDFIFYDAPDRIISEK